MSLRFALLAVLSAEPLTGYDLMRFFDDSVAFMWHAPHPNIYPELRKMEAEGLLDSEELPRGERGVKRRYRLTDRGYTELQAQSRTVNPPSRERDPHRLRAAYFEWSDPPAARAQLRTHLDHYRHWQRVWSGIIDQLRAREVPLLQKRLATAPEHDHDAIVAFKVFAYEGLVARAEMEIQWARRGLGLVDDLEQHGWSGSVITTDAP